MSKKAPNAEAQMVKKSLSTKHFGYDLDLLFEGLKHHNHILVAVSGGSDSVAMLYLLHDWAQDREGLRLSVATIDHRLRGESADEAIQVGQIAKKLGLTHFIEEWTGEKPASAVSQKSREARYALLAKIAHDVGATVIALGHNRDDQRETIMMRAKRVKFSDFDNPPGELTNLGLAGMHSNVSYCGPPFFKSIALVRPVLSIARVKLRLFLERMDENWIDDPSNEDDHYERVRLRKELAAHPTKYPSAYQIGKFGRDVATIREELAHKCTQFMAQNVRWQTNSGLDSGFIGGVIEIDRPAFMESDPCLMRYLLRALIGIAGGREFLIPPGKAIELVKSLQEGPTKQCSVGSAIIAPTKREIRIWRETRNLPVIDVSEAGENIIEWDGRIIYRFSDEQLKQNLVLKPLGNDGVASIECQLLQKFEAKPRQALFTQPAIFNADRPVFAPMANWCAADFTPPKWNYWSPALERFQPDCDFLLVDAISQLRYPAPIKALL